MAPSHLQVACDELWADTTPGVNVTVFLARYERGAGVTAIQAYFDRQLGTLDRSQRALVARAFDFLVASRGAKMAYDGVRLAKHLGANERKVLALLVGFVVSWLVAPFLGHGHRTWFAATLSGIVLNFFVNKYWTFRSVK